MRNHFLGLVPLSLWKRIRCFPSTLRRRKLNTRQSRGLVSEFQTEAKGYSEIAYKEHTLRLCRELVERSAETGYWSLQNLQHCRMITSNLDNHNIPAQINNRTLVVKQNIYRQSFTDKFEAYVRTHCHAPMTSLGKLKLAQHITLLDSLSTNSSLIEVICRMNQFILRHGQPLN